MKTKQKLFNLSLNGMLEQGRKSVTPDGNCKLRLRGLSCAVGVLISDEYYKESLERGSLCDNERSVLGAIEQSQGIQYIDKETARMLLVLQDHHDTTYETYSYTWAHNVLVSVGDYAKANGLSMEDIEWELTQPTVKHIL